MITKLHTDSLEQLSARIRKVEWMLEQGKQAMALNPDDLAILHSHRCMALHLQKLTAELNTALDVVQQEAHAA